MKWDGDPDVEFWRALLWLADFVFYGMTVLVLIALAVWIMEQ